MANCIRCGRQLPGFTFGKKICQWCVQHEAYQRGEIVEDAKQPVMRTPWVRRGESTISLTQIIFGINAAVFLGMALSGSTIMEFSTQETILWGANWGPLTLSGEWWRLLTCVFVHGGIIHIAFNMWCLWNLGALSESLYGRWVYASVYLLCGIGASLASIAWHPGTPSVGASGAIFGLAGALIAAFKLGEFSVPRSALSGTLRSLAMFVIYNLIFGQVIGTTDNAAHVGGLVTGLILGALIALIAPQHDHDMRRIAIFIGMTVLLAGAAVGLARYHGLPLRLGRAANFMEGHQPGRAIAHLEKMVKQRPNFLPAHFDLAQAYFNQGEYARAETELKRVLDLQPKHAGARALLGMVYLNQNRPQDAKDTFTQLLAQGPNNAEGHYGLGLALAAENNHQAAIEEYKTPARLDPQAAGIDYDLGVSYAKLKMYDDAVAAFLKERQNGDNQELETALADAYQAKGLTQQAQEARSKATQFQDREANR
ncbi:MAG: rhomboid family intramembrane serine protease [Candidatus Sulfotelmatobacter sp.]|jgi:rhomboid protease GluP